MFVAFLLLNPKSSRRTLDRAGMDWAMESEDTSRIDRYTKMRACAFNAECLLQEMDRKRYLEWYRCFKMVLTRKNICEIFMILRVHNINPEHAQTLSLKANTKVWGTGDGICDIDLCHTEEEEDICHLHVLVSILPKITI